MKWRLRRQENEGGEWSVFDPSLDYRICHYNHAHHKGAHVHHPSDAPAGATLAVESAAAAEAIMRRYRTNQSTFSLEQLKQEAKTWKSESDGN